MFNVILHLRFHQIRYKRSNRKAFGSKGSMRSGPEFARFEQQAWFRQYSSPGHPGQFLGGRAGEEGV